MTTYFDFLLASLFLVAIFVLLFSFRWVFLTLTTCPFEAALTIPFERKSLLKEVIPLLRTGDILLFSNPRFAQRSLRAVIGSDFDHSALVVREGERISLWESDIGQGWKEGPRLIPLEKKMDRYRSYPFFLWIPYRGKKIDKSLLTKHFVEYAGKELQGTRSLFRHLLSKYVPLLSRLVATQKEGVFCSELTYQALMDVGVAKKDLSAKFTPEDLKRTEEWCVEKGSYGETKLVYYDRKVKG